MLGNKLPFGALAVVAFAGMTVGAVSAMGGDDDDDRDEVAAQEVDEPDDDADGLDVDEEEGEAEDAESEDGDGPTGNEKIAQAIADEFEVTPEEVMALHDEGMGFGAIFKLYSIARAMGITVDELLASIEEDGGGFAFGKLMKSLSDEELAILEGGPKNLGELVSGASKGSQEGEPEEVAALAGDSQGPPPHGKAKGHARN